MTQKEKKAYLIDMCLKQRVLNNGVIPKLEVDGIQYTYEDNKLVVTGIESVPKDGRLIFDNSFDEINLSKELTPAIKRSIKYIHFSSISSLKHAIFEDCKNLEMIEGNKIRSLNEYGMFKGCIRLHTVNMSDLRIIGEHVFYGCKSLKTFIATRLSSIQDYAFTKTLIEKLECRDVTLSPDALAYMPMLTAFKARKVTYIGEALDYLTLRYLDIGKFIDNSYYYSELQNTNQIVLYYNNFGVTDKKEIEIFAKEDKYMYDTYFEQKAREDKGREYKYVLNDVLTSLPYKTLKEFHYNLNGYDEEVKKYYIKRFALLQYYGIKVVLDT